MGRYYSRRFGTSLCLGGLFLALCGCATAPTAAQIAMADYGVAPSTADAQRAVEMYLRRSLKDPASMMVEYVKGPEQRWMSFLGTTQFGYAVCAFVNAKNSFGGYVGARPYVFMIHDGTVAQAYSGDGQQYDIEGAFAEKQCGDMKSRWAGL